MAAAWESATKSSKSRKQRTKEPREQGRPKLFRPYLASPAMGATLLRRDVERRCLCRGHGHAENSGHGGRDLAHIHKAKVAMMRDAGSQGKKRRAHLGILGRKPVRTAVAGNGSDKAA